MSNLKQIGVGILMYIQDYDERYPMSTSEDSWMANIQPYVKSEQIFFCPSAPLVKNQWGTIYSGYGGNAGYGTNEAVIVPKTNNDLALSSVVAASSTYMLMDAGESIMYPQHVATPNADNVQYLPGTGQGSATNLTAKHGSGTAWKGWTGAEDDFNSGRHFGGVNMLFADGHVKWLQSQTVYLEAKPCGAIGCGPRYTAIPTVQSAFNPWADH